VSHPRSSVHIKVRLILNSPLISMLSHMSSTSILPPAVDFLYSVNITSHQDNFQGLDLSRILFYERLQRIANENPHRVNVELYCTGKAPGTSGKDISFSNLREGRITQNHLMNVLGSDDENKLEKTVCFVCGPPTMTDGIVAWFQRQGVRIYCEKWW
jgi:NAD(P)H-flavin reductase